MRSASLVLLGALAACGSDPYYNSNFNDPIQEALSDQALDARICADRFDAVEAAAAMLDQAMQARDATSYGPRLQKLNGACDEFYNGFLTRSTSCTEGLMKAGPRDIGSQMNDRVSAVCVIAGDLPVQTPN